MKQFKSEGYQIIPNVFSFEEVNEIKQCIAKNVASEQFGLREFLKTHQQIIPLIFTPAFKSLIHRISKTAIAIKSIYFDKPPSANWIVNWHQDLTINVDRKASIPDYKNWRVLKDRTVVQPSIEFLQSIFTLRIHLDDCTKENGALRIIKQSHQKGVLNVKDGVEGYLKNEVICEVPEGGVLLMKPLLLHASRRTENNASRRVIHIEFTDQDLPSGLKWKEAITATAS